MGCTSRYEKIQMRILIEDLIADRGYTKCRFMAECSCSPSFLRERKGELGCNPYVLNFISISNGLKVKPSELCLMSEGAINRIPRRTDWASMDLEWEDIANAVREYVDMRIEEGGLPESCRSGKSRLYRVIRRTCDPAYGHRVRLLSIYDVVNELGGSLSDFFLLLEKGKVG